MTEWYMLTSFDKCVYSFWYYLINVLTNEFRELGGNIKKKMGVLIFFFQHIKWNRYCFHICICWFSNMEDIFITEIKHSYTNLGKMSRNGIDTNLFVWHQNTRHFWINLQFSWFLTKRTHIHTHNASVYYASIQKNKDTFRIKKKEV